MATAHEIALQLLPWFAENVVARNPPLSYGYYAGKIGRDPAKEAIIVGHAMHAIGAVCVIRQLPVAPLHYVKRMDGEARQVFASNKLEADYVLRHVGKMRIVAREYRFTVLRDGIVEKVNYTGRTGGYATQGEQCAFVVENCVRRDINN